MHFCTQEVKGKKKRITNAEKIIVNVSHRGFAVKKLSAFQTSDEQKSQGISAGKLNAGSGGAKVLSVKVFSVKWF